MRTAEVPMESILTMLSTLSPENKTWLGHRLLNDAEEDDEDELLPEYDDETLLRRAEEGRRQLLNGRFYTNDEVFKMLDEKYEMVAV